MKSVVVSAPGKVIMSGDHAVVYGMPAIVAAVNRRMRTEIIFSDGVGLTVETTESDSYARKITEIVKEITGMSYLPKMTIRIASDIPAGYHLGSSAATAVTIVGALLYGLKGIWNPQRINELAYEAEKLQHGTPSGVDNSTVTFGGLLWYRKELEFLKSIWQLPVKFGEDIDHFYLLDTGRPVESTGEMVALVRRRVGSHPRRLQKIFRENEFETKRIAAAIKDQNRAEIIDAMRKVSRTLEHMGVVSAKAKKLIQTVESIGGAAKTLGGGGRRGGVGYLLCFLPDQKVVRLCGLDLMKIELGEEGVRLEKKYNARSLNR